MLPQYANAAEPEQEPLVDYESAASPPEDRRNFWRGLVTAAVCTCTAASFIFFTRGSDGAMLFIASYLMELSLSVDNMFAFYLIFKYYKCPVALQGTCLAWGIFGAIVLRGSILLLSTAVLARAKPLLLVFAVLLVYSALGLLRSAGDDDDEADDCGDEGHADADTAECFEPLVVGGGGADGDDEDEEPEDVAEGADEVVWRGEVAGGGGEAEEREEEAGGGEGDPAGTELAEEGGEEGGEGAATESSGMAEGMASSGSGTRGQERLTSAVAG